MQIGSTSALVALARRARHALLRARDAPTSPGSRPRGGSGSARARSFTVVLADRALVLVAEVVLHVAGARCRRSSSPCLPSNSPNISTYGLPMTCVSTLRRPRCAMPITTSRAPALRAARDRLVEHRHQRVGPLDREPLVARYARPRNRSRPSTSVSRRSTASFSSARQRLRERAVLHRARNQCALLLVAEVRELEADRRRSRRSRSARTTSAAVPDSIAERARRHVARGPPR